MSANRLIVAFEDENEQTLWARKFMIKISFLSALIYRQSDSCQSKIQR